MELGYVTGIKPLGKLKHEHETQTERNKSESNGMEWFPKNRVDERRTTCHVSRQLNNLMNKHNCILLNQHIHIHTHLYIQYYNRHIQTNAYITTFINIY